jgi:hypothetical protein
MLLKDPAFKVAGRGKWLLSEIMQVLWKNWRVTVPVGFITDFASIPRIGRSIIQKDGPHRLPAVLHDYLYKHAGQIVGVYVEPNPMFPKNPPHEHEVTIDYTRKEADQAFRDFLIESATRRVTRVILYRFVRSFGLMAWWKHRRARTRKEKEKNA